VGFEEDYRIDRMPTAIGVQREHQLAHEREVDPLLQAPVEVVLRDQDLQGEIVGERSEIALLDAANTLDNGCGRRFGSA
jgi:hypothetical protein